MLWLLLTLAHAGPVDAEALLEAGLDACREGRHATALQQLQQATDGFASAERPRMEALAQASLAGCQIEVGKLVDGAESAARAEALYAAHAPHADYRLTNLRNLCQLAGKLGDTELTVQAGLTLLTLIDQAKDFPERAEVVLQASWALYRVDRTAEAASRLQAIVDDPRFSELTSLRQAAVLTDLASLWTALGEFELALSLGDQVLERIAPDANPRALSDLHHNRAELHLARGDIAQAFNEGLTALQLVSGTEDEWSPMVLLSRLARHDGRLEASERWLSRARQSALSVWDERSHAVIDQQLDFAAMQLAMLQGRFAVVLELALGLEATELEEHIRLRTLDAHAIAALALGDREGARAASEEALALVRPRIGNTVQHAAALQARHLKRSMNPWLDPWLLAHDRPDEQLQALTEVLAWRATGQRQALRLHRQLRADGVDTGELSRAQTAWSDHVWRIAPPWSEGARALRLARDATEQALAHAHPLPPPTEVPSPTDLCTALPERGALVVYRRLSLDVPGLNHGLLAFVLRAGDCATVTRLHLPLPDHQPLTSLVQAFDDRLWRDPTGELSRASGERLRETLLDPLLPSLGDAEHLFVVPDDGLELLPWGALPRGERYLVEDYTVTVLDHVLPPESATPGRGTVLVAEPAYGPAVASPAGTLADCAALDLAPLPGTTDEVEQIGDLTHKRHGPTTLLLGPAATESALEQALATRPERLHLATHGLFLPPDCVGGEGALHREAPLVTTGLALAGAQGTGAGGDDGIWTGAEVSALDLSSTQLVVLSACDVGLGDAFKGASVQGMRAAFARAGVRQQLLAMVPVPDQSTRALMVRFYRELEQHDAATALRRAQHSLLEDQRRAGGPTDPGSWGAWVVVGR